MRSGNRLRSGWLQLTAAEPGSGEGGVRDSGCWQVFLNQTMGGAGGTATAEGPHSDAGRWSEHSSGKRHQWAAVRDGFLNFERTGRPSVWECGDLAHWNLHLLATDRTGGRLRCSPAPRANSITYLRPSLSNTDWYCVELEAQLTLGGLNSNSAVVETSPGSMNLEFDAGWQAAASTNPECIAGLGACSGVSAGVKEMCSTLLIFL